MTRWADELGTNAELRRRQRDGVVGFLVAGVTFPAWLRVMWLPLLVTLLGVALVFVGPVPGLGLWMVVGGAMSSGGLAINGWLGK